jgi:hypothetical protein
MIAEAALFGVLFAPIVLYAVAALIVFIVLRALLNLIGLLNFAWHPALFEVALYVCILSLLVLYW